MARIDMSNAHIEVWVNPLMTVNLSLDQNGDFRSLDSTPVQVSSGSVAELTKTKDKLLLRYYGTFTASGTGFGIYSTTAYNNHWKITNVSFQSGDTYDFTIGANLTCN